MNIDVYVVTHKQIELKLPDYCKMIQVNCKENDKFAGYLHDDEMTGNIESISEKNDSYCELTALYCLWKNSDADIKGLFHYRRFFANTEPLKANQARIVKKAKTLKKYCLTEKQIIDALKVDDVIVEIPYFPYPMDARKDLLKFCYEEDIKKLDDIIQSQYPDYQETYENVMKATNISYCNMIITTKEVLDQYCTWLFEVLAYCEKQIDVQDYDAQHKRVFGYFAEVLMNVYLRHNKLSEKHVIMGYVFEELPYNRNIDWIRASCSNILGKIGIPLARSNKIRVKYYNENLKDDRG